jgi:hypothetical protein
MISVPGGGKHSVEVLISDPAWSTLVESKESFIPPKLWLKYQNSVAAYPIYTIIKYRAV